jgi:hypothetical protein
MLIPIGSWCRTAWQVNALLKAHGVEQTSFPYDWTTTPFAALRITLDEKFNPANALRIENLELNKVGSITDNSTQLIHHHDFPPPKMSELTQLGESDEKGLPKALYTTDLIDKAASRFAYTYRHLEALKSSTSKVGFVRWYRLGHPDYQFPHVLEGETFAGLASVINNFLAHDNFSILTVKTQYINGELPEEPISEYERNDHGVSSTIIERERINGFKGDTLVWQKLLRRFVEDEKLTLSQRTHPANT